MNHPQTAPLLELTLSRTINATPEQVFEAWTTPAMMQHWFSPDAMSVPEARVDLKVGGEYLIHMVDGDTGNDHIVSGTYEEIVPNRKLVFNWMWKDGVDRSRVTVEMTPEGEDRTRLTLTHQGFSQADFRDKHEEGWSSCLDKFKAMYD